MSVKPWPAASCLLLALVAAGASADGQQPAWRQLEYRATKLLISATTTVDLRPLAAEAVSAGLLASEAHAPGRPPGQRTLEVRIESSVLGRRSTEKVWFDPRTAAALQRYKLRYGSKAYDKTQRFTERGVLSRRRSPADDTEALVGPGAGWSKVRDTWYAAPAAAADCAVLADPAQLFHLFSTHDWKAGQPLELCVFANKAFNRLRLRAVGRRAVDVDYADGGQHRRGPVEVLEVELRARPLDDSGEAFELMGLEGDVDLFLDPTTGIPVEIRGRMSKLGGVEVRLAAVHRR